MQININKSGYIKFLTFFFHLWKPYLECGEWSLRVQGQCIFPYRILGGKQEGTAVALVPCLWAFQRHVLVASLHKRSPLCPSAIGTSCLPALHVAHPFPSAPPSSFFVF